MTFTCSENFLNHVCLLSHSPSIQQSSVSSLTDVSLTFSTQTGWMCEIFGPITDRTSWMMMITQDDLFIVECSMVIVIMM